LTLLIHLWGASSRGDAAFRATGHLLTLEKKYLEQAKGDSARSHCNQYSFGRISA
jgi:hypothetical protein